MVTKTKKIFVGGLSAQTTVEDVKKYFATFGKVSTISIMDISSCLPLPVPCLALLVTQPINDPVTFKTIKLSERQYQ